MDIRTASIPGFNKGSDFVYGFITFVHYEFDCSYLLLEKLQYENYFLPLSIKTLGKNLLGEKKFWETSGYSVVILILN